MNNEVDGGSVSLRLNILEGFGYAIRRGKNLKLLCIAL